MYSSHRLPHSAIIEHTNKVLYMEDDDIAVVMGGKLSIHRVNRQAGEDPVRAIQTLQMELQQIMKGQTVIHKTMLLTGGYKDNTLFLFFFIWFHFILFYIDHH